MNKTTIIDLTLAQKAGYITKAEAKEMARDYFGLYENPELSNQLKVEKKEKIDGYFSKVELKENFKPGSLNKMKNVYLWQDFKDEVIACSEPVKKGKKFSKAPYFDLKKDMTGDKLKEKHPNSTWTATDFCAWLSVKLAKQPNGEAGELLNTGLANLFLVEGVGGTFVVDVDWYSVSREWLVRAWDLGREWHAGRRFVSKPIAL